MDKPKVSKEAQEVLSALVLAAVVFEELLKSETATAEHKIEHAVTLCTMVQKVGSVLHAEGILPDGSLIDTLTKVSKFKSEKGEKIKAVLKVTDDLDAMLKADMPRDEKMEIAVSVTQLMEK